MIEDFAGLLEFKMVSHGLFELGEVDFSEQVL